MENPVKEKAKEIRIFVQVMGTPGDDRNAEYIEKNIIKKISGVENLEREFYIQQGITKGRAIFSASTFFRGFAIGVCLSLLLFRIFS